MASGIINTDAFIKELGSKLNESMTKAAEPIIQRALQDIEVEMRKQLANNLIGFIDSNMSFERFGSDIRILISQPKR